jgi:hypothetical protein
MCYNGRVCADDGDICLWSTSILGTNDDRLLRPAGEMPLPDGRRDPELQIVPRLKTMIPKDPSSKFCFDVLTS